MKMNSFIHHSHEMSEVLGIVLRLKALGILRDTNLDFEQDAKTGEWGCLCTAVGVISHKPLRTCRFRARGQGLTRDKAEDAAYISILRVMRWNNECQKRAKWLVPLANPSNPSNAMQ